MKNHLMSAALFAACLANSVFAADEASSNQDLLISGPVERVDPALGSVTVFGRDFSTDKASEVAPGEIVNVYGSLQKDGSIADAVVEPTAQFGAGGDPVYIKGLVTDVNGALAQMQVGNTTVDYTQQLANSAFTEPSIGQVIAVEGTQPSVKGVVLASDVGSNLIAKASVANRGFSTLGTQGSGVRGLGTQGIGVTGLGTQGSGVRGLGTQGSGVTGLGTQGSGVRGLGTQGSGVTGLGTQGSGVRGLGTQGSGVTGLGTQGSGVRALGTQGSGAVRR